eukprot:TRINITY_DN19810_c0_g1_i1.p1 TRINITY_DN19810_c0_g1~~TRINITY_DN19810_c0_g1_i1.p1  ORF type:complete len:302 (+),score=93.33 TRINITY_DN19810_c0_g1_i1:136-1041(+)
MSRKLFGLLGWTWIFQVLCITACTPPLRPKAYLTDASFTDDAGRLFVTLRDGTVGDTLYQQLDPPGKAVVFDAFDRTLGLPRDSDRRLCDSILSLPPWTDPMLNEIPDNARPQYARALTPEAALTLSKIELPSFAAECKGAEHVYEDLFGERYSLRLWLADRTVTDLTELPEYAGPYTCTSQSTQSVAVAADDGRGLVWLAVTTFSRAQDGSRERLTRRFYFTADELKKLLDSIEAGEAVHVQAVNSTTETGFGLELRIPASRSQHVAFVLVAVSALFGMALVACLPYRKSVYLAGDKVNV